MVQPLTNKPNDMLAVVRVQKALHPTYPQLIREHLPHFQRAERYQYAKGKPVHTW